MRLTLASHRSLNSSLGETRLSRISLRISSAFSISRCKLVVRVKEKLSIVVSLFVHFLAKNATLRLLSNHQPQILFFSLEMLQYVNLIIILSFVKRKRTE